jgi:hypothetical protein
MSDCADALPGNRRPKNLTNRKSLKPIREGEKRRKKSHALRYCDSSEDSESEDRDPSPQRRSMGSSPIRKILGKPTAWGDPRRADRSRRSSFKKFLQ